MRNAGDFGRGRVCGCVRIALQLFVRCVFALKRKVKSAESTDSEAQIGRLKARRWNRESKMAKVKRKSSARNALEA